MLSTGAMLLAGPQNLERVHGQHRHATDPPRLQGEPAEPLQAGSTHPRRRPWYAAGQVVERSADADGDRHAETVLEPVEPQLLGGGSVRDEQDLSAMVVDPMHGLHVIGWIRRPGVSCDLQTKIRVAKGRRELGGNARCGAEEKQTKTPAGAHCGQRPHEVDARDGLTQLAALAAPRPYHPRSLRQAEGGALPPPPQPPLPPRPP